MSVKTLTCVASWLVLSCSSLILCPAAAQEAEDAPPGQRVTAPADGSPGDGVRALVQQAITAGGGQARLLRLFRMTERFNAGKELATPGTARVSVVEPPGNWWIGKRERGTEPAKIVAWAWTLGVLLDPQSRLTGLPDISDQKQTLVGLQVTDSVTPPLDMYFDKTTHRLVRVDWRNDIYRFSDWKEQDGASYPARCVMYRRKSGEPWFFHEIVGLERLSELPAGLRRAPQGD